MIFILKGISPHFVMLFNLYMCNELWNAPKFGPTFFQEPDQKAIQPPLSAPRPFLGRGGFVTILDDFTWALNIALWCHRRPLENVTPIQQEQKYYQIRVR